MKIRDQVRAHTLKDPSDFEWLKNTRVYWKQEDNNISVGLTDNDFTYPDLARATLGTVIP